MIPSSLTPEQAQRARRLADRVWQGEWKHRIILLIAGFAGAELGLMAFFETSGWDTPALFLFLALVTAWMAISHRRWFRRLSADLEQGELRSVSGELLLAPGWVRWLLPSFRFAVLVGEVRCLWPEARAQRGEIAAGVLPRTSLVLTWEQVPAVNR